MRNALFGSEALASLKVLSAAQSLL